MKQEMTNERWERVVVLLVNEIEMNGYGIEAKDSAIKCMKDEISALREKVAELERRQNNE